MSAADELAWCRQWFEMMAEGGVWAVPRSGLIFTRRGDGLELTTRMPWTEELAQAFGAGLDVPSSAEALRAYQDADYETIRDRFETAGLQVRDATEAPE